MTHRPEEVAPKTAPTELSPEQQEKAKVIIAALVEKFSTEKRKLTAEDFGVLSFWRSTYDYEKGWSIEGRTVVMLTAGFGLHMGSWKDIWENDDQFMVEIDGQQVDTRTAMDREVYEAFIRAEITKGNSPLPDSHALEKETGEFFAGTQLTAGTLLTGESPDIPPPSDDGWGDWDRSMSPRFDIPERYPFVGWGDKIVGYHRMDQGRPFYGDGPSFGSPSKDDAVDDILRVRPAVVLE